MSRPTISTATPKGGGEAVTSLLSGTTDSYFSAPIESGQHVKAGKLTLLGASSLKRQM